MFCSFTCRRVTNKVLLRSSRQRKGRHQVLLRRGFLRALPFLRWYPLNICCSPVTQTSPKTFDESVSLCSSWGMGLAKFFSLQERDLITSIYCKGNCVSLSLISKSIFCWNRRFGRIGQQAPHRLAQPRRPQLRRPHLLFERPEVARDTGEGSSNFFAKKLYINLP